MELLRKSRDWTRAMKDYRALIQVKATGRRKIVKLAQSIDNAQDARKALDI